MGSIPNLDGSRRFEIFGGFYFPQAILGSENFPKFSLLSFAFCDFSIFDFDKNVRSSVQCATAARPPSLPRQRCLKVY
jgi:hypothetical protein